MQDEIWDQFELCHQLTIKEKQVMWLIVLGVPTRNIALILECSSRTVEYHRKHILKKLNLHSTLALSIFIKHLLRTPPSPAKERLFVEKIHHLLYHTNKETPDHTIWHPFYDASTSSIAALAESSTDTYQPSGTLSKQLQQQAQRYIANATTPSTPIPPNKPPRKK
ncbi:LuxR C-terminal-related transcriptional regulator [Pelistega ratti]|uniref:LuxR C-terminal-related transcriptional regulator n=1 Tax=Pelistega ratti TaxID=2652177 RepID=UPI00135C5E33|nr:LuxR C-terminal-related transcriptional regulator [Pelistega ratti]